MRALLIVAIYGVLVFYGFQAPFVFALVYIWTDLFRPQEVAAALSAVPVSMICGIAMVTAWFACKEKPARVTFGTGMLAVWAVWMTICTLTAVLPEAWIKWDWAFKTAAVSVLLPYFFNSRAQIEAALLTVLISLAANTIPVGLKTAISGGGYGSSLGLVGGGAGIAEGSMLAMASVSLVPLLLWVWRHSTIVTNNVVRFCGVFGLIAMALLCALGTFARTGLVAVAVLAVAGFIQSKRKLTYALVTAAIAVGALSVMGDGWTERMSTIKSAKSEPSAMGRVAAWMWTLDYVKEHPLGGGFQIYLINSFDIQMDDGSVLSVHKKAFHSIYFEVLGELGIPGLVMFLSMLGWFLMSLNGIRKTARKRDDLQWMADLSAALIVTTLVFLAGGAFVGVAFQPYFWHLFAVGIALRHHSERVLKVRVFASTDDPAPPAYLPHETGSARASAV